MPLAETGRSQLIAASNRPLGWSVCVGTSNSVQWRIRFQWFLEERKARKFVELDVKVGSLECRAYRILDPHTKVLRSHFSIAVIRDGQEKFRNSTIKREVTQVRSAGDSSPVQPHYHLKCQYFCWNWTPCQASSKNANANFRFGAMSSCQDVRKCCNNSPTLVIPKTTYQTGL